MPRYPPNGVPGGFRAWSAALSQLCPGSPDPAASGPGTWFHGGMDVRHEWPFATVFAVAVVAVALIALGNLQHGVLILGCALLIGSGLRFALPTPRAGLLAVRGRGVDVVTMGLLGLVMLILSVFPLAG